MKLLNKEQRMLVNYMFYHRDLLKLTENDTSILMDIYIRVYEPITPNDVEFLNMIRTIYIDKIIRR